MKAFHGNEKIKQKYLAIELGIPEWLVLVHDKIFEGLSENEATAFPREFLSAIKTGSDFTLIKSKFLAFLMAENIERVEKLDISAELKKRVLNALGLSLELHTSTAAAARAAAKAAVRSAARSAAARAAESARSAAESAGSAAWSAAESAAESARSAAESAVWSARSAGSDAAAESAQSAAAWSRQKTALLNLLKSA